MVTHDDLKRLAGISGSCLTIYQPLRDDYSQISKPGTRLAAAIQESDRLLTEKGFDATEREDMLRPLVKVASNKEWTGRKGSLVMFRAPDFTMVSFWPDVLATRVHLADEFLVLPLLPGVLSVWDFWLLALSIKTVRLFRGSRAGLVEMALPAGVPKSLSEAGDFDQPDHSLRGRASAGPSVGSMKGVQFGTSSSRETRTDYLHDFFKAIDRGIHPILARDPHPLILAGVTREVAIYRTLNSYPTVLAGAVHGSPDALGVATLYAKGTELISAYSARAMEPTLRQMEEASNRGLLVTDPLEVIAAARLGQVDELVVAAGAPLCNQHEPAINWSALATIRNSGRVGILNSWQLSTGVAAVLRFRAGAQDGTGIAEVAQRK